MVREEAEMHMRHGVSASSDDSLHQLRHIQGFVLLAGYVLVEGPDVPSAVPSALPEYILEWHSGKPKQTPPR
eukprot:9498917-Pyramimonas_sp.AAC.1